MLVSFVAPIINLKKHHFRAYVSIVYSKSGLILCGYLTDVWNGWSEITGFSRDFKACAKKKKGASFFRTIRHLNFKNSDHLRADNVCVYIYFLHV